IAVAQGFGAPPASGIAFWLLGLFALSIGLPFAVLSASAPLLQGWFAASGHPQAGNPYVLYAASNLGSFAALIAYPVLIEPLLPLKAQTQLWSGGFAVLALAIAVARLFVAQRAPLVVAAISIGLLGGDKLFWLARIGVNLAAFVLLALLCHGELYRRRPAPVRLTEFYLWVSLGGVLGGIFAALLAPYVFNRVY